ncbi:MAG: hypothetical protein RLY93_07200 [Sumerlaeia bacterium]
MMAIFVGTAEEARLAAEVLGLTRRSVDGPLTCHSGVPAGWACEVRVYSEVRGAELAWAAARLACRRGAERIVCLGGAEALPEVGPAGAIFEVASVRDGRGLDTVIRRTADLSLELMGDAGDLPDEILLPEREGGPWPRKALATTGLPLTVLTLGRKLWSESGVALFDRRALGSVEGAREDGVDVRVIRWVERTVGPLVATGSGSAGKPLRDRALKRILRTLLASPVRSSCRLAAH